MDEFIERPSLGDLAESVALKLHTEVSAPVQEAAALTEEAAMTAENSLFTKIRFSWRPEDRAILERIRVAADTVFTEGFADLIGVVDDFYAQLWVPEQRNGIVVRSAEDRIVWQTDEAGDPIEDWSQLTGQDIEHTLVNLARLRMQLVPQVNQLMCEAVLARHSASDAYDDAWESLLEGTQGDRAARANRGSRQDRYFAYFKFVIYSQAKSLLDEVWAFFKLLTQIRAWQVGNKYA